MKFYTQNTSDTSVFFVRLAAVYSENCVLVSQVAKHVVLYIFPTHYAKSSSCRHCTSLENCLCTPLHIFYALVIRIFSTQFQSVENYLSSDHDWIGA